ncbi:MAG: helix-turn-helix domain-containing protein [Propionibacteriaceae bacterium]|nr:helix-turn-helix domain-containing protein [Propionibacteriaceae bacterium]
MAHERTTVRGSPEPLYRTYSPEEVARLVGTSKATVHRRIEDGTISASRVGDRYKISESEVERYRNWMMDQTAAALANDF